MRRSLFLLALISAPLGAQSFEGAISMKVTGDDGKLMPLNYLTKDGKIRYDMSSGRANESAGIVIDPSTQKMMIIMASQRLYMEQDLSQSSGRGRAGRVGGRGEAVRTGRTETIAGHTCEHVLVTDDDGTSTDACVARDMGSFRMFTGGGPMSAPHESGWATQLGSGAFPLKVQKGDKVIMEVTSIEQKSLEASLFTPPEGFRRFALPGRGRG